MKFSFLAAGLVLVASTGAYANTITFVTPAGATTSGPVDASATFTTGNGVVDITLTNLEANPTDVAQLLSDLDFVLSNGATTGTLASSSGQEITIASDGTFTLGSTGSTGWGLNNNVGGGLQLDALGFIGPENLIIGPAGSGGVYDNANSSVAGNKPHNPFLDQTATFTVDVAGVTAATTISSATFSFGTTAGVNVVGVRGTVPEPGSMLSFLMLGGAGLVFRKRLSGTFQR
ncbi:MAG TPA: PEP-CTERM sorting domain-containing protein [Bryobacteraceae bacterium]|nr:PEP-CTERM sorting domain-containing protein [Bryobacteraceae bacterium]